MNRAIGRDVWSFIVDLHINHTGEIITSPTSPKTQNQLSHRASRKHCVVHPHHPPRPTCLPILCENKHSAPLLVCSCSWPGRRVGCHRAKLEASRGMSPLRRFCSVLLYPSMQTTHSLASPSIPGNGNSKAVNWHRSLKSSLGWWWWWIGLHQYATEQEPSGMKKWIKWSLPGQYTPETMLNVSKHMTLKQLWLAVLKWNVKDWDRDRCTVSLGPSFR